MIPSILHPFIPLIAKGIKGRNVFSNSLLHGSRIACLALMRALFLIWLKSDWQKDTPRARSSFLNADFCALQLTLRTRPGVLSSTSFNPLSSPLSAMKPTAYLQKHDFYDTRPRLKALRINGNSIFMCTGNAPAQYILLQWKSHFSYPLQIIRDAQGAPRRVFDPGRLTRHLRHIVLCIFWWIWAELSIRDGERFGKGGGWGGDWRVRSGRVWRGVSNWYVH